MNSIARKLIRAISAFIISFLMLFPNFGTGMGARAAEKSNAERFDETDVLADLEATEVDGVPFDLKNYAFSADGKTSLFSFVEFCYSYTPDLWQDFGLYVYLHNPRGLRFDVTSTRNSISLRAGDDEAAGYKKYHLDFLSVSARENYEGLFYKFKVNLSAAQKDAILGAVNSAERQYRVSELELAEIGKTEITLVTVGTKYFFSGYAGYYGPSGKAESTLSVRSEQADTLTLEKDKGEIGFTAYRPDGSNGKNEYTQDSLHSVYFAVPNTFIETYGEMAAVHATWLNAVLKPMLVTGNKDAYDAIRPFLGKDIGNYTSDLGFGYFGAYEYRSALNPVFGVDEIHYGYGFNAVFPPEYTDLKMVQFFQSKFGETVPALYMMFYSGAEADSADTYIVSSKELQEKMRSATVDFGGELVNEKYSKKLFSRVDDAFTEINIKRGDTYDLTQEKIAREWWQKLFGLGGSVVSSTVFDNIPAIEAVTDEKFTGSKQDVCDRLYIGEADYDSFKACYDTYHEERTVYLLRYQVSDYVSQEAVRLDVSAFMPSYTDVDSNAYFFTETVNLDFDILDVTFSNGEKETVIPVAMSPVDVIPNATPPLEVHSDIAKSGIGLLEIIIGLILLIGIGFAVYYLISLLVTEGASRGKRRSASRKRRRK